MIVSVRKVSILFSNPILSWQSPGLCRLAKKKLNFLEMPEFLECLLLQFLQPSFIEKYEIPDF